MQSSIRQRTGGDRTRLGLAVFDHAENLTGAFASFGGRGLAGDQFGLAGQAYALERVRSSLTMSPTVSGAAALIADPLLASFEHLPVAAGGSTIATSPGPFWRELDCFGNTPSSGLIIAHWMAPSLRDELAAHIAQGRILLGVRSVSADQQKTCTQVLLNHSSHRVHTHEFKR